MRQTAGAYTITPSAAMGGTFTAANYNLAYVNGTLTVVAGALDHYGVTVAASHPVATSLSSRSPPRTAATIP